MLTRDTRGRAAAGVLAGMLMTAAAACGARPADGGGSGHEPGPRAVTAGETALLETAEEELLRRCMERRGFEYWPAAPPTRDELRDFPYVVDDPEWARGHGYGGDLQRKAAREQRTNRNAAYARSLPAPRQRAYERARSGDGTRAVEVTAPNGADIRQNSTGCLAQAQGELYGDFREWFRLSTIATNLPGRSEAVRRSPRYRGAVTAWSACMKSKGHPYRSPSGLQAALAGAVENATPHEAHRREVRLATAEAACARSTPLSATVRTLVKRQERADREKYGADIDAHGRMRLAALKRARDITGSATQDPA